MTHGKNICNQLKEVRKRIAEENDIPFSCSVVSDLQSETAYYKDF